MIEFNFAFVADAFLFSSSTWEWNSSLSLNGTDFNVLKVKIVRYFVALQLMLFIKFTFRDVLFIRFRRQSPGTGLNVEQMEVKIDKNLTELENSRISFHFISLKSQSRHSLNCADPRSLNPSFSLSFVF